MKNLGYSEFKQNVLSRGGIWTTDDVYFTQFRDGYGASYQPSFPNRDVSDCAVSYNWLKDKWTERSPEEYGEEYDDLMKEIEI